jgi:uncharacterized protein YjbI with pentapeptide repeats
MKIKIAIKNRWTGSVIFEFETENNTMAKTIAEYVKIARANLSDADLSDANLSRANLSDADLSRANLSDANLSDADLSRANLSDADLSRANLSDADLSDANLSDANLSRANLSDANLSRANLSRADLSRADLSRANLSDADLSDANLSDANLSDADLSRANLSDADLDSIKYDFFGRMLMQKNEIPALRQKVIEGKINGSQYQGECACFVGTIANVKRVDYDKLDLRPNSNSPTEKWFMRISEGMNPETHNICKVTLDWIDEFLLLTRLPNE